MQTPGKLFVFEGPDGVGKTRLARTFAQQIKSRGIACDLIAFPGRADGSLGKHVYRVHHDPSGFDIRTLTAASVQALHIAAHIDSIERVILPAIRQGKYIVLDRYWWSTWVYGVVSGVREQQLRAMINVERVFWEDVRPNAVFLLERDLSLGDNDRIRLRDEYRKLGRAEQKEYTVKVVRNDGTVEAALSSIVQESGLADNLVHTNSREDILLLHDSNTQIQLRLEHDSRNVMQQIKTPFIASKLSPAKPTVAYDTYWRFAAERQAIFFRRLERAAPPWTSDEILRENKFTNVYRASDRASQFLIKNVIYKGDQKPAEVFFRVMMFKLFNRIGTWELLTEKLGRVAHADYSFRKYDSVLTTAIDSGERIYSAAYIMPSGGPNSNFDRKHRMHLSLIERMMKDHLADRIADAPGMGQVFDLLHSYPTIGSFLAYQYATDLNYSTLTNFTENDFVMPGPGALSGIRKCFVELGGLTESEVIKLIADRQEQEFSRLGLVFQGLWGREMKLIDCQNVFCEVDKYSRIAHPELSGATGRTRIKQKFHPSPKHIDYWFPPKWGLNDKIPKGTRYVSAV